MLNNTEKVSPYNIILKFNSNSESYRVSKELFVQLRKELQPYRSITNQHRVIRCVETNQIFTDSYHAVNWLIENKLVKKYSACIEIRNACNGNIESAFGYHWEYIAKNNLNI